MTTVTELDHVTAINTSPNEDTPRLGYADWLDETGGTVPCPQCVGTGSHALNPYELANRYGVGTATKILDAARCGVCSGTGTVSDGRRDRAEFIRVQCELAAIGPADTVRGKGANLRRRERELWGDPGDRTRMLGTPPWMLLTIIPSNMTELSWGWKALGLVQRGFVAELRCTAADWLEHADALAWSPGATDECPDRVPRPCPPTAQPIRKVTLTTYPNTDISHVMDAESAALASRWYVMAVVLREFAKPWRWIEFTYDDALWH